MKNLTTIFVLLCFACAKPDFESEKKSITQLIEDETKYAAAADTGKWADCWVQTDDARFIITTADGAEQYDGWNEVKEVMRGAKPFDLKLQRNNYNFTIGEDVAFASFDQQDNWDDQSNRRTKETRTLKKIDGRWKIVDTNVITVSSFENPTTVSFHVAKEKLPVDPKTSFRNKRGLGGMSVGIVELPAGTDFSPMFVGLPQDMCPSPHWGYVFEGTIRIKYPDGKEDVVNAGEVFYWPAPHTGLVEKNVRFIDFSPDQEFAQVMDHIAIKMAEQKKQ